MKGKISLIACALMAAALPAVAVAGDAMRAPASCASSLSAMGVSSHTEGGRDFERYKGQVPPGLARRRAIENWQLHVTNACPQFSARWWRARAARIDCENAAGREYCTATAQPARKLMSFLWRS